MKSVMEFLKYIFFSLESHLKHEKEFFLIGV